MILIVIFDMAITFHLREPTLSLIFALLSFIVYLFFSIILLRKEKKLRVTYLFLLGSIIGVIWFILDFFIPGIYLPAVPTPEEIEFTLIYGWIFNGLIQDMVLIFSVGIFPILFYLKNKLIENIKFLAIGAIIQIISVLISIGPDAYGLSSLPQVIISGIAIGFFIIYGKKNKYYFFLAFAVTFFISRLLVILI